VSTKKAFCCDRKDCTEMKAILDLSLECPDLWCVIRLLMPTGERDKKGRLIYQERKGVLCPHHMIEAAEERYSVANTSHLLAAEELEEAREARRELEEMMR
jgi:hypothetical protein